MNRFQKGIVVFSLVLVAGCAWMMPAKPSSESTAVVSERRISQLEKSRGHTDEVLLIAPVYGTKSFVTASKDGQVLLWTGAPLQAKVLYKNPFPIDLAAIDLEKKLLAVSAKSIISIVELESGDVAFRLDRIKAKHLDLEFAPGGQSLYFGTTDNNVYRWRFAAEKRALTLQDKEKAFERYNGPALPVSQVNAHPNGRLFFSGDWNGSIEGWMTYDSDRQGGYYDENLFGPQFYANGASRVKFPRGDHEAIDQMRLSPDGTLLLAGIRTGALELFKVRGAKKAAVLQDHSGDVYSIAFSPNGDRAITVGRDDLIHIIKIHRDTEAELKAKSDRSLDYELTIDRELKLDDVVAVAFQSDSSILAGNKQGAVLQISLDQMTLVPTPAPTPTHTPRPLENE